ncbi:hypothetical protein [Pseudonocardia endophytica]|uniref:Small secreted domain DUF320 n=1 Tax=Pseudonocardia endophytica TaxID=401976 RepID=A0A4R1HU83_PSEEN|nr:hypothetical protein [Pseudonocardia endophytica]TCK20992.1 hypothetical protein EV378_4961 [Pseudonocardia endophytica]
MVKKLAIVGAGIVAALLAVSPFAMATDEPHGDDNKGDRAVIGDVNSPSSQTGLVNVGDVNLLNGTNVCPDVGANVGGLLDGVLPSSHASAISCDSLSNNNNN